jgi:hypothetical protein
LAFRTKGKLNAHAIATLAKTMGITINKNVFTDNGFKNREAANMLKEKIIFYISKIINEENAPEGFN